MEYRVEVDQVSLRRLVAALDAEADGKNLIRDLTEELRKAAEPAALDAQAMILAMPSTGARPGRSLRTAVADAVEVNVRARGKQVGVAVRVRKDGMPRGFANAPKRLNARKGWRHQVFGNREVWVTQVGQPDWFDDAMRRHRARAKKAAEKAVDRMAERISARTR